MRWKDAVRDESLRARIAWTPLKVGEAAIRAVLSFDCDPSYCVDIVEQVVLFDSPQAQVPCALPRPTPP